MYVFCIKSRIFIPMENKENKKEKKSTTPIDGIYTVNQLSSKLEINPRTIAQKIRGGEIKGYKKLGKWFVFKEDLIKYLKS